MVKILQKECDRQSRKIIEQFRNKRDFDQRVSSNDEGKSLRQGNILLPSKRGYPDWKESSGGGGLPLKERICFQREANSSF